MNKTATYANGVLFAIPAFIWGTTWFAITFQLNVVEPLFSVAYRFILAGFLLISYCKLKNISLSFSRKQHLRILLQALFLFGFNYWFTYQSEQYIASGLVALIFSSVIFLNILFSRLFLGSPVRKQVVIGAVLGLLGTVFVFAPELINYETNEQTTLGIILCIVGVLSASLGNITSASNQKVSLPVISTNAIGMLYGGISMFLIAIFSGKAPTFDTSLPYILSLLYLSVFGSIVAFGAYLTLIGKIGADRAAYVLVIMPVIAISVSVIFEGYRPGLLPIFGVALLVVGNIFVLRK